MIKVQGLTVSGEGGGAILKGISTVFSDGQLNILVGPNGSGKSTLLKSMMGFWMPSEGSIFIDEKNNALLKDRERARCVAYLPQSRTLPQMRVREMVLHGRFPYLTFPHRYSEKDREIVNRSLEMADAADLKNRRMEELSGGQRQKAYLAMALSQQTQHILLDEPTTFLDLSHQIAMMRLCARLAGEGRTILMVLHDLCMALAFADRLFVMENGRLVAAGAPEEIEESGVLEQVFHVPIEKVVTENGMQRYIPYPGYSEAF